MCASPLLCKLVQTTTQDDALALVVFFAAILVVTWILDAYTLWRLRRGCDKTARAPSQKPSSPNSSSLASSSQMKGLASLASTPEKSDKRLPSSENGSGRRVPPSDDELSKEIRRNG